MLKPTACDAARLCSKPTSFCARCDLLVGLDGFYVVAVDRRTGKRGDVLEVFVETLPESSAASAAGWSRTATAAVP